MDQDTTVTEVAICITHALCFCSWYKGISEGLVGLREEATGHVGWGGGMVPLHDDRTSPYSRTEYVLLLNHILTDTVHIIYMKIQGYVKAGKSQTADPRYLKLEIQS